MIKNILNKIAFIKALKELGRIVGVAVLPVIAIGINTQTGDISIDWKIALAFAIAAILKAIDKYLHELGKELNNDRLKKGIIGF